MAGVVVLERLSVGYFAKNVKVVLGAWLLEQEIQFSIVEYLLVMTSRGAIQNLETTKTVSEMGERALTLFFKLRRMSSVVSGSSILGTVNPV